MPIRRRSSADLDDCVSLLRESHAASGYPMHWPADPRGWLTPDSMLEAWVAEEHGRVSGHIALCAVEAADRRAQIWAARPGIAVGALGSISRLFVSSSMQRQGIGGRLLHAACIEAADRRLHPVLDVVETNSAAIRLYESKRWVRIFSERWSDGGERDLQLLYYVAPDSVFNRAPF
jgi:GNAT superfamily N-acetyltransferase